MYFLQLCRLSAMGHWNCCQQLLTALQGLPSTAWLTSRRAEVCRLMKCSRSERLMHPAASRSKRRNSPGCVKGITAAVLMSGCARAFLPACEAAQQAAKSSAQELLQWAAYWQPLVQM